MDDSFERKLRKGGKILVIGVDEVGRGALAGPVVAAACTVRNVEQDAIQSEEWKQIDDSKKLSEKERIIMSEFVKREFHVGMGYCTPQEIDSINILQASLLAMSRAVEALKASYKGSACGELPSLLLVDGNQKIPKYTEHQRTVIRGDGRVQCIAAASIVAKVHRDEVMRKYALKYPQYEFEQNKGYPTKRHNSVIAKCGITKVHRKTFRNALST